MTTTERSSAKTVEKDDGDDDPDEGDG